MNASYERPPVVSPWRLIAVTLLIQLAGGGAAWATDHSGTIAVDETWHAADNPHVVTANVVVNAGVTLTLEPGVVVRLYPGTRLETRGQLNAVGTAAQTILFTRNTTNWGYLYLTGAGSGTFEHCVIEYATYGVYASSTGSLTATDVTWRQNSYGIYGVGSTAIALTSCRFENGTYGMRVQGGSLSLASTTFANNSSYGLYASGTVPTFADAAVVFQNSGTGLYIENAVGLSLTTPLTAFGNATAGVHLAGCEAPALDNLVLQGNGGAYGALYLVDCGEFTLGAGNTIGGAGQENSWPLSIGGGSYPAATSAIPTSGNTHDDIQVTGGTGTRSGTWHKFADLDYVVTANTVFGAGTELAIAPGVAIRLGASCRLEIRGLLTASGAAGQEILFTRSGASNWNYLYFTGAGAAALQHCVVEYATYGCYTTSSGDIAADQVLFRNNNYSIYDGGGGGLSFADCSFQSSAYGIYTTSGPLTLASTTFTGHTNTALRCTGVAPAILDANVSFAGNATGIYVSGSESVDLTTPMAVTGSTVAGIELDGCGSPALDNLVLTGNAGTYGALYLVDCGEFTLGANNTIGGAGQENSWPLSLGGGSYPAAASAIPTTGNTHDDIQVAGGTGTRSGAWPKFADLDYVVTANAVFGPGSALTIAPEVIVRLDPSCRLEIRGLLTAIGAAGQEILFTRNGASDWSYLYFTGAGAATLQHCVVEHATYGCYTTSSGNIDADHVLFRDNNYSVYDGGGGGLSFADCGFQNSAYGIYTTSGPLTLASTTFTGHSTAGLRCTGVSPAFLDGNVSFAGDAIGMHVSGVAGLSLTAPLTVSGCTAAGIRLEACDGPTLDNLVLTGNAGSGGPLLLLDCGEFTLGAGNTIGGAGQENSWPLSIGIGSFPSAASVIPTSGNTSNDIQIVAGSSARTGTLRSFAGLDYVVTGNGEVLAGGVLNVDPGVVFRFAPSCRLQFRGALNALGAAGQEIVFTQNTASPWSYLYFLGDGAGQLQHCIIEHATYGIYAASAGTIATTAVTLRENATALYATAGTVTLVNDRIHGNATYGIHRTAGAVMFGSSLGEWNDIWGNGSGVPGRDFHNGNAGDVEAKWVYWGTMDHGQILTQIWDLHDDWDLGLVRIMPFSNETHDSPYSAVEDPLPDRQVPAVFALDQNAPNPFNPQTVIRFDLPAAAPVELKIFDVAGELVAVLVDQEMPAGRHEVLWRGRDDQGRQAPSGLYFYRLKAGDDVAIRRMVMVK